MKVENNENICTIFIGQHYDIFQGKIYYEVMTRNINFSITFEKHSLVHVSDVIQENVFGYYIIKVLYNLHVTLATFVFCNMSLI